MIVLDTHIWFWWVQGSPELTAQLASKISSHEDSGLIVSAISLVEVARAHALGGMELSVSAKQWLDLATSYPGVRIAELDSATVVEAYQLPGEFHKDPADRLIVATARIMGCALLTIDQKILDYPHVNLV